MHAYVMHARGLHAHKIDACEMHAYEVHALGGKYDFLPNLWALIGGTRLIPLDYLGVVRPSDLRGYSRKTLNNT